MIEKAVQQIMLGTVCKTEAQTKEMAKYLEETEITVEHIDNGCIFDIIVEVFAGKDSAKVRIANYHTNIVRIEKMEKSFTMYQLKVQAKKD